MVGCLDQRGVIGLRWDFDGPLSEKYGKLTAFNGNLYNYNAATDTIVNSGLEIAGTVVAVVFLPPAVRVAD